MEAKMFRNIIVLIGIVVMVGIVSGALAYWRASVLAAPADVEAKGLPAMRRQTAIFYGVFVPILVGVIAFFLYRFVNARWPATAETTFLIIIIAIAAIFEVMAAIVFKMRGLAEFTVFHILYAFSFGWLMPRLLVF
jgi:hypothetical protein